MRFDVVCEFAHGRLIRQDIMSLPEYIKKLRIPRLGGAKRCRLEKRLRYSIYVEFEEFTQASGHTGCRVFARDYVVFHVDGGFDGYLHLN